MNWYKKALRKDNIIFETEHSQNMKKYNEFLQSNDGDLLPLPESLGVKDYVYISYIYIPKEDRQQGRARQIITDFVNQTNSPIFVNLVDSQETMGSVLKNLFLSLGFIIFEEGTSYIEMFKK